MTPWSVLATGADPSRGGQVSQFGMKAHPKK